MHGNFVSSSIATSCRTPPTRACPWSRVAGHQTLVRARAVVGDGFLDTGGTAFVEHRRRARRGRAGRPRRCRAAPPPGKCAELRARSGHRSPSPPRSIFATTASARRSSGSQRREDGSPAPQDAEHGGFDLEVRATSSSRRRAARRSNARKSRPFALQRPKSPPCLSVAFPSTLTASAASASFSRASTRHRQLLVAGALRALGSRCQRSQHHARHGASCTGDSAGVATDGANRRFRRARRAGR